ncbi:MAG: helicase-related protein [Pseudomonadota bacterium]
MIEKVGLMGSVSPTRIRNVTAVLGPTNTGKTHLAIERMLDHETGVIGLPLRLLAREVYDRVVARAGASDVALVTGEEKIKPENPRYWVCTVEAMPQDVPVQFMAIDEIQLAADPERGHVFTHRLLNARGDAETLMLGADTMREAISELIPGANFISRPRLSKLTYAGQKKITRLPARSAVVAFSAGDVYSIAELIRRQRGGAAVVLGALSPKTRNAQVALYQSGDVDFLVATDAVGMGLNLDVDHVAFSAVRKFDGYSYRDLKPSEIGQIAGRAGRHLSDGTFGVTGDVEPFSTDMIERLENHSFDSVKTLQWRNRNLDFSSVDALRDSLRELPNDQRLMRARTADDVEALENLSSDREIMDKANSRDDIVRLWDVCQIPDYRKISSQTHAELISTVYSYLMDTDGLIDDDWFAKQVEFSDRVDGDIDTLSNRLSHIRTWTFVANRPDWLKDPQHWQERTRQIEDNLSDALHERLTQRFVDKRTSALMKGLKDKEALTADISDDGQIKVQDHFVGRLVGFRYIPDTHEDGIHGKAARNAAAQVLSREISMRVRRVAAAKNDAFKLTAKATVLWRDDAIATLSAGEDPLKPQVNLIADEYLLGAEREKVLERINTWVSDAIAERLKPMVGIAQAEDVTGLAKGIAFRLLEEFGILRRETAAAEIKALDQTARAQLRRHGLRFGAFNLFFPILLKPAAAEMLVTLWCLKFGKDCGLDPENLPEPPRAGLTSVPVDPVVPDMFYKVCGFHKCGPRAVRVDILERLADRIRPLLSWKPSETEPTPPKGATGYGAFTITPEMMSILGCSADELREVLQSLGFRSERKRVEVVESADQKDAGNTAVANAQDSSSPADVQAEADDVDITAKHTHEASPAEVSHIASEQPSIDISTQHEDAVLNASQAAAQADASGITSTEASSPAHVPPETSAPHEAEHEADNAVSPIAASETEEEAYIEIWRPKRRNDAPRRGRRNNQDRNRHERSAGDSGQGASDNTPGEAVSASDLNSSNRKRSSGGGGHTDRGAIGDEGPRGKRKNNRRQGADRNQQHRKKLGQHSSTPKKRGDQIDPDSPFAALSALRQAMAEKENGT